MEVQLEPAAGLVRQMRVKIPAERVSQALTARIRQLAGRARIAGFRPGKAPIKVVERQYGEQARLDVVGELVRGTYREALEQAGVNPASAPDFQVTAEKAGEPLEYVARFEVYPEIRLQGLDRLAIERPQVEIGEADIDKLVQSLRRNRRTFAAVTRPAQAGDRVTMDFEGSIDGVPFDGGKAEKSTFELGEGRFLPDLESGVAGHAAGESFTVPVTFPADYRREDLRGKQAQFAVKLTAVEEPTLPGIDAEFLKAHGVEESAGAAGLQEKCRIALVKERDKGVRASLKSQALDQLLALNPIDVPQSMVVEELKRLREEAASRFNAAKLTPEQKLKMFPDEALGPQAQRRVALGLLIGEIIRAQKITADPARIERALDEIAVDYEQVDEVKAYYRSRPEMMQGIRAMVMEEQVVEALIAAVSPTDRPMSLDQLLGARQQG